MHPVTEFIGIEYDGARDRWVAYLYRVGPNYRVDREMLNISHTEMWLIEWLQRWERDRKRSAQPGTAGTQGE